MCRVSTTERPSKMEAPPSSIAVSVLKNCTGRGEMINRRILPLSKDGELTCRALAHMTSLVEGWHAHITVFPCLSCPSLCHEMASFDPQR